MKIIRTSTISVTLITLFVLSIAFLMIYFIYFKSEQIKEAPKGFSFIFQNSTQKYDSRTGLYTRKFISKDSTIKVILSQEEINKIYSVLKNIDFMNFPNEFECSPDNLEVRMPCSYETIEISFKGINKKVENSNCCGKKIEQKKSNQFKYLSLMIMDILYNKAQIKNMPKSDKFFL